MTRLDTTIAENTAPAAGVYWKVSFVARMTEQRQFRRPFPQYEEYRQQFPQTMTSMPTMPRSSTPGTQSVLERPATAPLSALAPQLSKPLNPLTPDPPLQWSKTKQKQRGKKGK